MSARIQEWIHFIEEGAGAKAITAAVAVLGFIALAVLYDLGSFKNFNSEEAMDVSQLARHIARGEGYTTDYIRPASLNLIVDAANKKRIVTQTKLRNGTLAAAEKAKLEKQEEELKKIASWKTRLPDLENAPAYPVLLAGLLKIAPLHYQIADKKTFSIYAPELWIAGLNQILFLLAILILYKTARQLFDRLIAIISAVLFAATELFWRFSVSGLPTMLLLLIFLCLAWTLVKFNQTNETRDAKPLRWAFLAGILVGLGCLTRYSFGWLIAPVILFILLFGTKHSIKSSLIAFAAFCVVISPWLARNHSVSGNFFGTAGYAICEGTPKFQEDQLERSLERPSFGKVYFSDYLRKFTRNSREIFENEIPKLGGSWLTLFFLVGLLIPLQTRGQSRLRIFLLFSLLILWFAEAFGRAHLSIDSPQMTSENFLVLATPLIFIFGVALYFELLRRIVFPEPVFLYATTLLFCVIISAPLIFTLLPPSANPSAYPPYSPPLIQETSGWMRKNELIMSDIPWAVAWYGNQQSVLLTLDPKEFLKFNDDIKSVEALYLTPRSIDRRLLSQMIQDRESWGRFIFESISRGELPEKFPLKKAPAGFFPEQIFLTDWDRWTMNPK